jgi:Rieske 2Fe-2S family protein
MGDNEDTATPLQPTLPGRYYTDPEVFASEEERIFAHEWVYVARGEELPDPGAVVRRRVGAEELILVRGADAHLRAFYNVCRHRGATVCLEESAQVGTRLRCPYHGWTYHLDGGLASAPNWGRGSGDRARYGLGEVALSEWAGMVWVNLDPDARTLADQLRPQLAYRFGGDTARIDRYGLDRLVVGHRRRYEVGANWKLIYENFQECYHCSVIHPELVEQIPVFKSLRTLAADDGYQAGGYAFAPARPSFSLSGTAGLPSLPGLGELDQGRYFGMILRPNCFVSLLPDHAIVHRFEPTTATTTSVVCEWLFAPEVVAAPGFDPTDTTEIFHRVNEQDFQAAEWCQPNMASRSYREGGVLVPLEAEIIGRWFHGWYRDRMGLPAR